MMNFLRRFRRHWFGPTTREILWMIHVDLSRLDTLNTNLKAMVDDYATVGRHNRSMIAAVKDSESRLGEVIEAIRSEPFMALKTWLDKCTISQIDAVAQRREFIERERLLLARWENQVGHLWEQIEDLTELREPVAVSS